MVNDNTAAFFSAVPMMRAPAAPRIEDKAKAKAPQLDAVLDETPERLDDRSRQDAAAREADRTRHDDTTPR